MADSKITALTSIGASTDPANDPLVLVDVSDTSMAATGTTKKVTLNQLLGASGTATLASATITGDLTVDTNTLKVDSVNNRVGIGTASPAYPLDVNGAIQTTSGSAAGLFQWAYGASASSRSWRAWNDVSANGDFQISTSTTRTGSTYSDRYRIDVSGVHEWSNTSGLAMTLNSTGLGVGTSPSYKLDIAGSGRFTNNIYVPSSVTYKVGPLSATWAGLRFDSANAMFLDSDTSISFRVNGGASFLTAATIDTSGNVGIGVTPSAKLHVEGGGAQARFSIASASDARHEYYRNGIREGLITWDANVIGLYATQSFGEVVIASSNTLRVRVKAGGQVRFVPLASDPAGAEAGDVYYNSTSNKLKCYNGTTWNDLF